MNQTCEFINTNPFDQIAAQSQFISCVINDIGWKGVLFSIGIIATILALGTMIQLKLINRKQGEEDD